MLHICANILAELLRIGEKSAHEAFNQASPMSELVNHVTHNILIRCIYKHGVSASFHKSECFQSSMFINYIVENLMSLMNEFSECPQSWWYQVSSGSRWCCMGNPSHTRNTWKKKFCKVTKRLIVSQPPWTGECGPCPRPQSISSSSSSASSLSSATGGPPGTARGLGISALETGSGSSSWWRRAGRSCSNVPKTWLMQDLRTVRKCSHNFHDKGAGRDSLPTKCYTNFFRLVRLLWKKRESWEKNLWSCQDHDVQTTITWW